MIRILTLLVALWLLAHFHGPYRHATQTTRVTGAELLRRPGGELSVVGVVLWREDKSDGSTSVRVEAQGSRITGWIAPRAQVLRPGTGDTVELRGKAIAPGVLNVTEVTPLPKLAEDPTGKAHLEVVDSGPLNRWTRSGHNKYFWLKLADGTVTDKAIAPPNLESQIHGPGRVVGYPTDIGQFQIERWEGR
jgi:hypothetical protein